MRIIIRKIDVFLRWFIDRNKRRLATRLDYATWGLCGSGTLASFLTGNVWTVALVVGVIATFQFWSLYLHARADDDGVPDKAEPDRETDKGEKKRN